MPAVGVTEFSAGLTTDSEPTGITLGPDGNIWFTEQQANKIGRITPSGTITEFSAGITASAGLRGITAGADGKVGVWLCADGKKVRELTGHTSEVYSVAFHSDG